MNSRKLSILCGISLSGSVCWGQPSITQQPQGQAVEYGSDVDLSVSVQGSEPISYYWTKNGNKLSDYGNIADSQTADLHVIGVANNDAGNYAVVISNSTGALTSAPARLIVNPTTIFEDHFESGLLNWKPLLNASSMALQTNQNHTPEGSWSAVVIDSSQVMYHNLGQKLKGRTRLSGWIYDNGGNQRAYIRLQGNAGIGYGKYAADKALLQTLSVGIQAPEETTNGVRKGEDLDPTLYQAFISRGMKTGWDGNKWFNADLVQATTNEWTNSGWFNLDGTNAPHRSVGWHKFAIDWSSGNTVDFYVDGLKAREIGGVRHPNFDTVIIGSSGMGKSNELAEMPVTAWFDDIKVENYTPSFDSEDYSSTGGAFPDWMVLREVRSTGESTNVSARTVFEAQCANPNASLGNWVTDASDIYATGVRGWLEYSLTAPANDAYRVEIEGRERNYAWPMETMHLLVWLDGEYLGPLNLSYSSQTNGLAHFFTPYILAGPHTVRLLWDNSHPRRSLDLRGVRLQSLDSPSVNGSGMKTWVANRLEAQNGIEVCPSVSLTSPVCVEGRGQYLSMMSLTAGSPLASVSVKPGAGYRWYANISLITNGPTQIVASYQSGGMTESNAVTWQPINLLQGGNVTIRQGDSLLLSASQTGVSNIAATIAISDGTSLTTDTQSPVPYQFNTAGTFTVTGSLGQSGSGTITVSVVSASLEPVVPVYASRNDWVCTNLAPSVVLDPDPRLGLKLSSSNDLAKLHPLLSGLGINDRVYRVQRAVFEPRYVLARLGQNGPILSSAAIQGCDCSVAPESALEIVSTANDGTQTIEGTYVLKPVLTNVAVRLKVLTAGVTFDDGTIERTVQPSQFDSLGIYKATYIRSPGVEASVCIQRQFRFQDSMRAQQ